jgi:hypothetical protein
MPEPKGSFGIRTEYVSSPLPRYVVIAYRNKGGAYSVWYKETLIEAQKLRDTLDPVMYTRMPIAKEM